MNVKQTAVLALLTCCVLVTCSLSPVEAHPHHGAQHGVHHGSSRHGGRHDWGGEADVSYTVMVQRVTALIVSSPSDLAAALSADEGQACLRRLGVPPGTLETLAAQLGGQAADVARAQDSLRALAQSVQQRAARRDAEPSLRALYRLVAQYAMRQAARLALQSASLDQLLCLLGAFSTTEQQLGFRGINFSDLLQTLRAGGQSAMPQVQARLVAFVSSAHSEDLQRAARVYKQATAVGGGTARGVAGGCAPVANTTTPLPPGSNFTTFSPTSSSSLSSTTASSTRPPASSTAQSSPLPSTTANPSSSPSSTTANSSSPTPSTTANRSSPPPGTGTIDVSRKNGRPAAPGRKPE